MIRRSISLLSICLLAACGGRSHPGELPDSSVADAHPDGPLTWPDQAVRTPDACVRPPGGCFSDNDCPAGQTCEGCGADPCCPMCAVCYGRCQPATDPACAGKTCGVLNDCCECAALRTDIPSPFPPCVAKCKQPMCDAYYFKQPESYCLKGNCLLTDIKGTCSTDADCHMHNDCCTCAALPLSVKFPPCPATCFQPHCAAIGIGTPKPRCINGQCKVSLK